MTTPRKLVPDAQGFYEIPFTEYVLPNGKKRALLWLTQSRDFAAKADAIITNGFTFEIERLGNGVVSVTVTHSDAGDMAHVLSYNNKTLTTKITQMITEFDIAKQTARVRAMLQPETNDDD